MFGPRHRRFITLRHPDGRIRAIVAPGDPRADAEWLRDPGVRHLFRELDRKWRLAHGATVEDEADREREEAASIARLRERIYIRRGTR